MTHCVETCFPGVLFSDGDEMRCRIRALLVSQSLTSQFKYLQNTSSNTDFTEGSFPFSYSCDHLCWSISQAVLCALCKLGNISIWPEAEVFCCMAVVLHRMEAVALPSSFPPLLTIFQQLLFESFVEFFWVSLKIFILGQHCMFHSHNKSNYFLSRHWLGCLPKQSSTGPSNTSVSHAFDLLDDGMLLYNNGKGMKKLLRASLTNQVCVCFIESCNS